MCGVCYLCSWNNHGIVKVINYCQPLNTSSTVSVSQVLDEEYINVNGISRYFAQRHISQSKSIEDLIERCNTPDRASGYHVIALVGVGACVCVCVGVCCALVWVIVLTYIYPLLCIRVCLCGVCVYVMCVCQDIHNNRAVSVEVTAKSVSVEEIYETYIHTNHYIHANICKGLTHIQTKQHNNDCNSTSVYRYNEAHHMIQTLKQNKQSPLSIPQKCIQNGEQQQEQQHTCKCISVDDLRSILHYRGTCFDNSILCVAGDPHLTFVTFSINSSQNEAGSVVLDVHITGQKNLQVDYNTNKILQQNNQ